MKYTLLIVLFLIVSCSPGGRFAKDRALFEASAVQLSFRSVADMNDSYFVIRENNFFEFYRELFDSIKNSSYPGRYSKNGDTLLLHFYNKKGTSILGSKALVSADKKQVRFFK